MPVVIVFCYRQSKRLAVQPFSTANSSHARRQKAVRSFRIWEDAVGHHLDTDRFTGGRRGSK